MNTTNGMRVTRRSTPSLVVPLLATCAFLAAPLPLYAAPEPATIMDEVVVTATRTPHTLKDVPVETIVIDRQDMEQANAQNAMQALKSVPGITSAVHDDVFGTYTWRASMRGLNFNDGYGLILINGQRVMGSGQSGGMGEYGIGLNQIPVAMIERIEVVKGPSSALYGSDALAGVINIITRSTPAEASGRAGVSYGWYKVKEKINSDGSVSLPSDDGTSRNVSQSFLSFGDRPSQRLGYLINYSYESADDIRADPIKSDRHSVMAKLDFAATNQLDFFLKGEASDYEKIDNRSEKSNRLSMGAEWRPGDAHMVALKGYTYNWDFSHGYPGYAYGFKFGDISYDQAEIQYTWYATDNQALTMGGEIQQQAIDYTINNSSAPTILVKEDVDTGSLYGQDEITLFDDLTVVAGLRFDHHSNFGDETNPKLSLMYGLGETTTLRASAGRAFKSPTIRQLYYDEPYRHGSYYVQSNRNLKPEIGKGYGASVEQRLFADQLLMSLGLFRNEVRDMVVREDTGTTYDGLPLLTYMNVEEAITQGVELMVKLRRHDFSLGLAYTYTASENKATGRDLTYVPRQSLVITPAYAWPDLGLSTSCVISSTGKQYKDSDNTSQIDGHTVLDGRIAKDISEQATLIFEADNILDSDKGDDANFRSGRTLLVKMDVTF